MNVAIRLIESNLEINFEIVCSLIVVAMAIIVMARSVQLGAVMGFLLESGLFAAFYAWKAAGGDVTWVFPCVMAMFFLVVMCLTLYLSAQNPRGVGVV